jgi:putative acetyltransferase
MIDAMPSETSMFRITAGGLDHPQVIRLLGIHLASARAQSAPGSAHALDLTGLKSPDIRFWSAWEQRQLVAVGAMKHLSASHGEVKSMHTAEPARRRGAGSAMLAHIIDEARKASITRLSLETGSWDYFRPAVAFYKRHGFVACGPFADYRPDPNSIFMTLDLRV